VPHEPGPQQVDQGRNQARSQHEGQRINGYSTRPAGAAPASTLGYGFQVEFFELLPQTAAQAFRICRLGGGIGLDSNDDLAQLLTRKHPFSETQR